jgi:prepilin-type N-terminal cleavage/methylation domain-containing protein
MALRSASSRNGFSLIELLLVVALIGIISAIAIPAFIGQRRRARVIGDAISNSKVLAMQLENRKADSGVYGAAATYDWKADGSATTGPTLLPAFVPQGSSKMNFTVVIANNGLSYTLTATAPEYANATAFQTDQNGKELYRMQ